MFINVRRGVFETNSSSTHSISIANDGELNCQLPIRGNNCIYVSGGEWGWERESYVLAIDKLNYLVTYIFQDVTINDFQEHGNQGESILSDLNFKQWVRLSNIIKNQIGADLIVSPDLSDKYFPMGYIDHQSLDVASSIFDKSDDEIVSFIFNPRSVLETDYDN